MESILYFSVSAMSLDSVLRSSQYCMLNFTTNFALDTKGISSANNANNKFFFIVLSPIVMLVLLCYVSIIIKNLIQDYINERKESMLSSCRVQLISCKYMTYAKKTQVFRCAKSAHFLNLLYISTLHQIMQDTNNTVIIFNHWYSHDKE